MNPEERALLERSLKLGEENNKILRSMQRRVRWAFLWGMVKFAIIVVPIILGYLYLEPLLGPLGETLKQAQDVLGSVR